MPFDPITAPCDYVLLGGKKSPGVAELVGPGSPRNWDVREGFGLSGAFVVYKGRGLAKFALRLKLCTEQDFADWQAWKPIVDAYPKRRFSQGKDSGALDIWHPALEDLQIRAVVVEDIGQPDQVSDGEWHVEIKLLEFRRPKIALAKPDGAQATPADPVEDLIFKPLLDQVNRLAAEND